MDKITGIYRSIMQETEELKIQRERVEKYIEEILEKRKKKMSKTEYEICRDLFYQVATMAEEGGFVLGFQYATRLMAECMEKPIAKPV